VSFLKRNLLIGDVIAMAHCNHNKTSTFLPDPILEVADMPYVLYLSLQGKYFVGYADNMTFGNGSIAWAGLINPIHSRVNLHVYVWTVTNIGKAPLTAQVWFNIDPPGQPVKSQFITPANTALCPLPRPKIKLLEASNVIGETEGSDNVFVKRVSPEVTIAKEEEGKLIFPPGGSFIITLSNTEAINQTGEGRVAFGWSEEKLIK
jgi:hypothetical protein